MNEMCIKVFYSSRYETKRVEVRKEFWNDHQIMNLTHTANENGWRCRTAKGFHHIETPSGVIYSWAV